jgi:hypothetical protein
MMHTLRKAALSGAFPFRMGEAIVRQLESWSRYKCGFLAGFINKAGRIWGDGFRPRMIWAIVKANRKSCNDRIARLAPDPCTAMPSGGSRPGTNLIPAGPCLSPDDRAIPWVQAAVSPCSQ